MESPTRSRTFPKSGAGTIAVKRSRRCIRFAHIWLVVCASPLVEQSRIVTRVASLRRLCADLCQRLTASQSTQAHLAEALVQDVA